MVCFGSKIVNWLYKLEEMKKLVLLFAVAILNSMLSLAQMEEGHVSYDIKVSSDEEGMEMAVMMLNGSTFDLYFADKKARSEMDMGSMMKLTTIVDDNSGEVLMLTGSIMGNRASRTTTEELGTEGEEAEPNVDIKLTKKTKEIAGYKCKKAIITDVDGNEMEFWYTEEIKASQADMNTAVAKLPGQALEYSINQGGMMMSFTATKVETSLSAEDKKSKFDMTIPEGYEEVTWEEFNSTGGM